MSGTVDMVETARGFFVPEHATDSLMVRPKAYVNGSERYYGTVSGSEITERSDGTLRLPDSFLEQADAAAVEEPEPVDPEPAPTPDQSTGGGFQESTGQQTSHQSSGSAQNRNQPMPTMADDNTMLMVAAAAGVVLAVWRMQS